MYGTRSGHQALKSHNKQRSIIVTSQTFYLASGIACLVIIAIMGTMLVSLRQETRSHSLKQAAANELISSLTQAMKLQQQPNVTAMEQLAKLQPIKNSNHITKFTFGDVKGQDVVSMLARQRAAVQNVLPGWSNAAKKDQSSENSIPTKMESTKVSESSDDSSQDDQFVSYDTSDMAHYGQQLDDVCCDYDGEFFPLHHSHLKPPKLIGLGVHKAGTTYLNSILRTSAYLQEPESQQKELLTWTLWPLLPTAFANYLEEWNQEPDDKARNYENYEITATYLHFPPAACRIARLLPDTKFVITLRDPVSRCLSHFNMWYDYWSRGERVWRLEGDKPDLGVAFRSEIEAMTEADCALDPESQGGLSYEECFKCSYIKADEAAYQHACKVLGHRTRAVMDEVAGTTPCDAKYSTEHFVQYGLYAQPIQMWLKLFPKENFMFIRDQDMFADPVGVGNKVLKFMGLPQDIRHEKLEHAPMVQNKFQYIFDINDPVVIQAVNELKQFYASQVQALYNLFKEQDIDFPHFDEWPVDEQGKVIVQLQEIDYSNQTISALSDIQNNTNAHDAQKISRRLVRS